VTKFFGCELGAQTQMNAKDNRYIVNGAHDCEKLQNLMDSFIKRFVLCPTCDLPETKMVKEDDNSNSKESIRLKTVRKRNGGEIHQLCHACGYQGNINLATHKLTTYIVKNPPDSVRSLWHGKVVSYAIRVSLQEGKSETNTEVKSKEKTKNGKKGASAADGNNSSDEASPNENHGRAVRERCG
jgi:translation initiation factor 5